MLDSLLRNIILKKDKKTSFTFSSTYFRHLLNLSFWKKVNIATMYKSNGYLENLKAKIYGEHHKH